LFVTWFEVYAMAQRQASGDDLLMKGFGDRLRLLREAYGEKYGTEHHSRARWADRLFVSAANYGRWEAGESLPKFEDMLRISLLFQVDPNYLIAGVLSEHLAQWLYQALKQGNPRLLDAADYWRRQSEVFSQANRATGDAPDPKKPSRSNGAPTKPSPSGGPPVLGSKRRR
jgi:transcriptional regulator with XRE-family HTH domain